MLKKAQKRSIKSPALSRELPVGARQQTKTPNSPQSSFAEQIMWIEKIRDTRYLSGIMIT